MRLAKSLTNRDMQITFTFLNTLWKSEDEKGTYEYKKRRETDKAYWPEIW